MSFLVNDVQQFSLFDSLGFLSARKQQMLEKSWAKTFSDVIFKNIDEMRFAPLYSEKRNSRPNAPINVIVGALIIKEMFGLTDDEVRESLEFDLRFQYALHTTSFEEQPISDRTFSRFRSRCAAYELTTGIDLIHDCIASLSKEMAAYMEISGTIRRMDSMMVESNIRVMGRLELLYTCLANLVKGIYRDGNLELIQGMEHYARSDDRNKVIYHEQDVPQAQRQQQVIDDAGTLLPKCRKQYENTEDYQLLLRAINEQTKGTDGGGRIPKEKGDGMMSDCLQNPADPDATYRMKAGEKHRGYAANLTEFVDENGSVITDYQYDINTTSDAKFMEEYLERQDTSEQTIAIIVDGAYSGEDIQGMASEKNIGILATDLTGRKSRDIHALFQFSDDGTEITKCPNGNIPKSSSYIRQTGQCRASFYREQCENCPHRSECRPSIKKQTAVVLLSAKAKRRAEQYHEIKHSAVYKIIGRIRNRVETTPSRIRNKYLCDKMPVRGKLRTKQFFGFKVMAANAAKLMRYVRELPGCIALQGNC